MNAERVIAMDVSHPLRGLLTPGMAGVLEVLTATTAPLTGREVHRLIRGDVSLGAAQQALTTLEHLGLVDTQPAGRARLHTLNREHVLTDPLLALAGAGSSLEAWLASVIDGWSPPPVAAWLFGSAARGDGTAASDIDIALVGDPDAEWDEQIVAFTEGVQRRSGNVPEVLIFTLAELNEAIRRGDPIIDELRRDARPLVGAGPRELLRTRAAS